MKENFITEIATTWGENISEYFSLLQQHPIRLVSLILDLTIVIYIIVKICLVISVFPILSGMRTLLAGTSVISFVLRSMLMYEGIISPVSLSTRSITRPMLPVAFRFLLSYSENLCPLYSSSFCSLRMKCGTRPMLPSSFFLNDRRASSSKVSSPNFGDTFTRSDLP